MLIFYTICLYACFFALGFMTCILWLVLMALKEENKEGRRNGNKKQ